jgi:hypothetical protein
MKQRVFNARKKNKDAMTLVITDQDFQNDIELIRKKFEVTKEGEFNVNKAYEFAKDVGIVLIKYGLPKNFNYNIGQYILRGTVAYPVTNFGVIPLAVSSEGRIYKSLKTEVFAELNNKEEKEMIQEMNGMNKLITRLPKYGEIKDIEEKLESEQCVKDCNEYNSNPYKEYQLTVQERLETKNKSRIKQVHEYARSIKEQREKRFRKK